MNRDDDFHKQPTSPGVPEKKSYKPAKIPEKIGPYKIESLLEKGGMSLIYLSHHPETNEPATIKVISPKYAKNQEVVAHFLKEAEIIKMADHPNIVKLYDLGHWEEGIYLAMEFVEGITLRQYILQNPSIPLRLALEFIIDISYALCHLHTHGVIHRDLKPENILITKDKQIKVIDFGIAQLLTEHPQGGAAPKMRLIGTPIYMSPEQRENPENVSFPSDIYSLGIIAYELILGKLCHGRVKLSQVPKGIGQVLLKALQPLPSNRYHDVVDFITDVSHFLKSTIVLEEKEMTEKLKVVERVRETLIPKEVPKWSEVSIGLTSDADISNYYDFFVLENRMYAIIMGESFSPDVRGVVNTSYARGMIRALHKKKSPSEEILASLNDLLVKDRLGSRFSLNYLVLSPEGNFLNFISCGLGALWILKQGKSKPTKITSGSKALGVDEHIAIKSITEEWQRGDKLLLCSFAEKDQAQAKNLMDDAFFSDHLITHKEAPPQDLCDLLGKELKTTLLDSSIISYTLICIHRE